MTSDRRVIWQTVLAPYRNLLLLLLFCQVMQSLAALTSPALSANVIDQGIGRNDTAHILHMGWLMLAAGMTQLGFALGAAWLGTRIAMGIGADLRSAVFARVQAFSLHELRHFGTASLITRCTNDIQQIQNFVLMVLTMIVVAPIMGIGGVLMAVRQDVGLSALLAVSVPLLAVLIGTLMVRALPLFGRMQGQVDRINQVLREQITGLRVIRAFVRDTNERQRFASANDALTDTSLRVGQIVSINMPIARLIMEFTSIALVWFAAQRIATDELGIGSLVAFLAYITQILMSVMMASLLFVLAPRALVSARRVREVLATPSSVAEPVSPKPLRSRTGSAKAVEIAFHNVSFSYPGADQAILQDVSFTIKSGQTLAVIGATGSGKSTIIQLAARLFDVSSGSVCVDGIDIRELSLETLWSLLGIVPQESYLFSGTVADNLRYGCANAGDPALWHALEVAQAKDFVTALADGLNTPVAQGGSNFSGGQRQRLTIARALVRRPAIYLLDDCFSALDYATDARLRADLVKDTTAATTLIVGQRVNSLRHADTILLLDKGVVEASGSHNELLAHSATYRDIVDSQHLGEGAT